MTHTFNYEPTIEHEHEEIPNNETLKAVQEAEKIAEAWRKRKHG